MSGTVTPFAVTPTTFNPSDKAANITLSGGNLAYSLGANAQSSVRSIFSGSTGKYYWEITCGSTNGNCGPGIANGAFSLTGAPFSSSGVCILYGGTTIYVNGTSVLTSVGIPVSSGSIIGIALDLDNKRIWFRGGPAGFWNASSANDPSTNTGGVDISGITGGSLFAFGNLQSSGANATANFGPSGFAGAVPSNFQPGFGTVVSTTTWNPSDFGGSITLSNGNLTATSGLGASHVRSTGAVRSGKYYWEYTCGAVYQAAQTALGISNGLINVVSTTNPVTVNALNRCVATNNLIYLNGVNTGIAGFSLVAGSLLCVALDMDSKQIWFRLGAVGNWNNNAAYAPGGTGGINIASIALPGTGIYANFGAGSPTTNTSVIANFGASGYSGAVPSGYGYLPATGVTSNEWVTQALAEQWLNTNPQMQVTQALVEEWITVQTQNPQMVVTQAFIEEWMSVAELVADRQRVMIMA